MTLQDFLVQEDITVMDAVRRLDETGRRILFVVSNGALKAALSDGDIRRYIMTGRSLNEPVGRAANYHPYSLPISERRRAQEFLAQKGIDAVPLLDEKGSVADIVFSGPEEAQPIADLGLPVVMMAGGLGTRLYPYTKILPKPLIPIGEQPIAEHIIDAFRKYGSRDFYMVVNYRKNMIKSYFADLQQDYTVHYADEDQPLGTGGGLALLKGQLHGTFILTNCDVLVNADFGDIYRYHKENHNIITMICACRHTTIPYGVVELEGDGRIASMTEKPQMNYLTNTGVYLVEPCVLEEMRDNVNIGFPDIIAQWREKDNNNVGVYPVSENCWMDMGQIETLEDMRRRLENTAK